MGRKSGRGQARSECIHAYRQCWQTDRQAQLVQRHWQQPLVLASLPGPRQTGDRPAPTRRAAEAPPEASAPVEQ